MAVCIWNIDDLTRKNSPQLVLQHAGRINALASLVDGRIASGGDDKVIRIWNAGGTVDVTLEGHTCSVLALAVLDQHRLAAGDDNNSIYIWNVGPRRDNERRGDRVIRIIQSDPGYCFAKYLVTLGGDMLAACGEGNEINIWDVSVELTTGNKLSARLTGHSGWTNCIAALDGGRLASGSDDTFVIIWNV